MKVSNSGRWPVGIRFAVLLAVILAVLFGRSFLPGDVHFNNDGPLGQQHAQWLKLPSTLFGIWNDLNDTGFSGGTFSPGISPAIMWLLGPVGFAKFMAPVDLFILGIGAWVFFRALKLAPLAAGLGALAVTLSTSLFAGACWGVASVEIAIGFVFLALALVMANQAETRPLVYWARLALAGLCVGVNVMEAADMGALCSLFVAGFVGFEALVGPGGLVKKAARGMGRVLVVAVFAGFIAMQTVLALIGTSIVGIAGTGQDAQSKVAQWDFATQWSLPKKETLGMFVPGLFGYRMDTPQDMLPALQNAYNGGVYWGGMGRTPAIDRFFDQTFESGDEVIINADVPDHPNQSVMVKIAPDGTLNPPLLEPIKVAGLSGLKLAETIDQAYATQGIQGSVALPPGSMRFGYGGYYCGVLVALVAFWTMAQSLRGIRSPFTALERKFIWFWAILFFASLLVAWGRFAPMFYGALYQLPYFSTIRNPAKFFTFSLLAIAILFAYGIHALSRLHLAGVPVINGKSPVRTWDAFDRKWTYASLGVFGACVVAWLIFSGSQPAFVQYLQTVGFGDAGFARQIAAFSVGQVGWFIALLAVAIGLLTLLLRGCFSGLRAWLGAVLLGAFLIFDLGRADLPFIIHWNYIQKYDIDPANPGHSTNPIINLLADQPYEHRVAGLPFDAQQQLRDYDNNFGGSGIYRIEWMQHHFPYYNIQCLDLIQMSRMPEDLKAYLEALSPHSQGDLAMFTRHWQLTNTRYLLGAAGFLDALNQELDPGRGRFRIVQRFDIVPKPGVTQVSQLAQMTAVTNRDGDLALFEFTGALPRAKLYANWQVNTNDPAVLKTLADLNFDPLQTVLVDTPEKGLPAVSTNANTGTVMFQSYAPKDIVLSAQVTQPSVLLLNDKYDPQWTVTVDGQPAPLLRCNYLMRGVYLTPGAHTVKFHFALPNKPLVVTLAALAVGLGLAGFLFYSTRKTPTPLKS